MQPSPDETGPNVFSKNTKTNRHPNESWDPEQRRPASIHARNLRGGDVSGWLAQGAVVEMVQLGPDFRQDDEI